MAKKRAKLVEGGGGEGGHGAGVCKGGKGVTELKNPCGEGSVEKIDDHECYDEEKQPVLHLSLVPPEGHPPRDPSAR